MNSDFFVWMTKMRKALRHDCLIIPEYRGMKNVEVWNLYIDQWNGAPMLGCYIDEAPFSISARDVFEKDLLPLKPEENEES